MRAYGLVLRGQHLILKFTKEANWHARRLFEEATDYAPEYSRAFSALSRTHNLDWRYAWSPKPKKSLAAAVVFARRAKELDHLDARGFSELGYAKLYCREHDEALAEYGRALSLNPNDSDIIAEYADALAYAEQPQRGVELLHKAMRLNPYYPDWYLWYLADVYDVMGRHEDVIVTIQRMHDPSEGQRLAAANYAHLGMMDEARGGGARGFAPAPELHHPRMARAPALSRRGRPRALYRGPSQGRPARVSDSPKDAPWPGFGPMRRSAARPWRSRSSGHQSPRRPRLSGRRRHGKPRSSQSDLSSKSIAGQRRALTGPQ